MLVELHIVRFASSDRSRPREVLNGEWRRAEGHAAHQFNIRNSSFNISPYNEIRERPAHPLHAHSQYPAARVLVERAAGGSPLGLRLAHCFGEPRLAAQGVEPGVGHVAGEAEEAGLLRSLEVVEGDLDLADMRHGPGHVVETFRIAEIAEAYVHGDQ